MSYLVLALKWRPQTFDEIVGQEAIAQTLKNAIRSNRVAHAYLFTGPRGVGKTSAARILAKALNCVDGPTPDPCNKCDSCRETTTGRSLDVFEIDGASNRGIDDIRELRENVRYAPASGRVKVYIIDEVHMLTTDAFNALLKTLEEPPSHVVFVLATTEPLKVPATIVSRCQRFDFSRLRLRDTHDRLKTICTSERIEVSDDALSLIARRAEGSMRDALTLLDQVIASGRSPLDTEQVTAALGIAGREFYFALGDAILDADPGRALSLLSTAYSEGQNLQEVSEELVEHLRNLLVLSIGAGALDLIDATDSERERYRAQADRGQPADLIRQLHLAMEAASRMRRSGFPRVVLEVAVAEIALMPRSIDLAALVRHLPEIAEAVPPPRASSGAPPYRVAPVSSAQPAARSGTAKRPSATQAPPPSADGGTLSAVVPADAREEDAFAGTAGADAAADANAPDAVAGAGGPDRVADAAPTAVQGDELWLQVIERVRKGKPALAAALAGSAVIGEEGGFLRIRFSGGSAGFQIATIENAANRPVLQKAIQEVYGRSIGCKVESAGAPRSPAAPAKKAPPPPRDVKARSNLNDIQRIADKMDGEVLGPA
jgi:DNA polymerase III subunit gamma/tau